MISRTEKFCKRCDNTKPIADFSPSKGRYDGVQAYCRDCMKEYRKESYRNNPESYKARANALQKRMREYVNEVKSVPCFDCKVMYPTYVMDFDHRERSDKISDIAALIKNGNWKTLKDEIAKCDVVCANCHRERTWGLTGNMRS